VFVFSGLEESGVGASSRDVIYDFVSGTDQIDLRLLDANTSVSGDQAFVFAGSAATAYAVWVTSAGSDLLLRGDNDGDGVADFEIMISNTVSFGAGDVLL
jgi:serralysin